MSTKIIVEREIGNRMMRFETGQVAKQASGCVMVTYGDTVVMCTAMRANPRPGLDFFPLQCDYRERTSAAGKFPGGFRKREGAPNEKEILTMRLMDRPIRPLFPVGFYDEVQVQANVLASDRQTDGDVLAMNGASAALCISELPFQGPIGSVRLAQIDGAFVPFPSQDQLEESDLDLVVSGSKTAILMIEGFAREMPEDRMLEALEEAHRIIVTICEMQDELVAKAGKPKKQYDLPDYGPLRQRLTTAYYADLKAAKATPGKLERAEAVKAVKDRAKAEVLAADAFSRFEEEGVMNPAVGEAFRQNILERGGSEAPEALFERFRGRPPKIDALLRHCGIEGTTP